MGCSGCEDEKKRLFNELYARVTKLESDVDDIWTTLGVAPEGITEDVQEKVLSEEKPIPFSLTPKGVEASHVGDVPELDVQRSVHTVFARERGLPNRFPTDAVGPSDAAAKVQRFSRRQEADRVDSLETSTGLLGVHRPVRGSGSNRQVPSPSPDGAHQASHDGSTPVRSEGGPFSGRRPK